MGNSKGTNRTGYLDQLEVELSAITAEVKASGNSEVTDERLVKAVSIGYRLSMFPFSIRKLLNQHLEAAGLPVSVTA